MKKLPVLLTVLFCFLACTPGVSAHIVLRDKNANIGALIHVNPDDDPVAGRPAQMNFSIDDSSATYRAPYKAYSLSVTGADGKSAQAVMSVTDTTVIGTYVFPSQGIYTLNLTAKAENGKIIAFRDVLRVSRGIVRVEVKEPEYPWATIVLWNAGIVFLALLAVFMANRRAIIKRSTPLDGTLEQNNEGEA